MSGAESYFREVTARLRAALGLSSDEALAERLGMKRTAFAARKSRGSLPTDEVEALCIAAKLNPEWVFHGQGKMHSAEWDGAIESARDATQTVTALGLRDEEARSLQELLLYINMGDRERVLALTRKLGYAAAPRYDLRASAGPGAVVEVHDEAVTDVLAFRRDYLRELGIQPDQVAVISVRGDSMADTLQDGDLMIVDTSPPRQRSPGVYVLSRDDSLLVKRLHFRADGRVEIRSDNRAYPTETISSADFAALRIVGRMVRRIVR